MCVHSESISPVAIKMSVLIPWGRKCYYIHFYFYLSQCHLVYILCIFFKWHNILEQQCIYNTFGEGNGTPLQYSCLENPMDRGPVRLHSMGSLTKSSTRLSDFTFTFHFHALEKEMAAHSSVLAWRIPGTGEPGGLPSIGQHRVGHD